MSRRHFLRYQPAAASLLAKRPDFCTDPFASTLAPRESAPNQEALS